MSAIAPCNTVLMFETLLSAPVTDESHAEDWNQKRLYAMKKVRAHPLLHSQPLIPLQQAAEIEKAFARGQKPVAGNPEHDWTLENMERQVLQWFLSDSFLRPFTFCVPFSNPFNCFICLGHDRVFLNTGLLVSTASSQLREAQDWLAQHASSPPEERAEYETRVEQAQRAPAPPLHLPPNSFT